MRLLVGWGLGGASFTIRDQPTAAGARLGEPVWGPAALLRDLELRLGLPPAVEEPSLRIARWAKRIAARADADAFYAASSAADAIGTAEALLLWRDALVEAGWDGSPIPGGGRRLEAIAELEALDSYPLPLGDSDRLARIVRELPGTDGVIYERVALVEARELWPAQWQRIFDGLEARGTAFDEVQPELPGASPDTDLGLLQSLLRENSTLRAGSSTRSVVGDGTLLFLRGETPIEVAELTATLLNTEPFTAPTLVIRSLDVAPLEAALARRGLPLQGHEGISPWRPATQVLALAMELAFEPRDPYRVLELLTLPVGPFRGRLGSQLAKAIARQPGIGGQEWTRRKSDAETSLRESHARYRRDQGKSEADALALATTYATERMRLVSDWIESAGASRDGAARAQLLDVVARVQSWLQPRAALDSSETMAYRSALAQTVAFRQALANHPDELLSKETTQHLLDSVARSATGHDLFVEHAGRCAHIVHPSAVLAPATNVVFWNFVAGAERRPANVPWSADELQALAAVGVRFVDRARLLAVEAQSWRRAVLAARERVVFVAPRSQKAVTMAPHPLWDEITARLGMDEDPAGVARISREVAQVLHDDITPLVPVRSLEPLVLPEARAVWHVPADAIPIAGVDGASPTALQTLVSCPLAWLLEHGAHIRFGAVAKVAEGALLNGNLSHRLVEELFNARAFELDQAAFLHAVDVTLERLIATEGATLFLEGAAFERTQLSVQVRRAMRELHRYLTASGFRIAAVEESIPLEATIGSPHGRLDVRLVDPQGNDAVLDLKWGASAYRELLANGRAIQLAVYARALAGRSGSDELPPAGYYAISAAKLLTCDDRMQAPARIAGVSLEQTWTRVENTRNAVRQSLERGEIPVAATRNALPLLEQLGVPGPDRAEHYQSEREAPCEYCAFSGICGRAWEKLA